MIIKGTKVKTTRDMKADGHLVPEGTIMKITGADFESDFAIYQLETERTVDNEVQYITLWANGDNFGIL